MAGRPVAIAGVGYSPVARRSELTWQDLVIDAVTAALGDAGLTPADVDGMTSMGGNALGDAAMLGVPQLDWYAQFDFGAAFIEPAVSAASPSALPPIDVIPSTSAGVRPASPRAAVTDSITRSCQVSSLRRATGE